MTAVILDYGVGNLYSLGEALETCGARVTVEGDPALALRGDALILPGVGAFNAASTRIASDIALLRAALLDGHPCLGICLGMQLLFEQSEEGTGAGIGVLNGRVQRLSARCLPHMGWNDVRHDDDVLFTGLNGMTAYFANSYAASPADERQVTAWSSHESRRFPAAVRQGRTWGVQFHPEKSDQAGLTVIRNFITAAKQ